MPACFAACSIVNPAFSRRSRNLAKSRGILPVSVRPRTFGEACIAIA
jgi:hypothetical protein